LFNHAITGNRKKEKKKMRTTKSKWYLAMIFTLLVIFLMTMPSYADQTDVPEQITSDWVGSRDTCNHDGTITRNDSFVLKLSDINWHERHKLFISYSPRYENESSYIRITPMDATVYESTGLLKTTNSGDQYMYKTRLRNGLFTTGNQYNRLYNIWRGEKYICVTVVRTVPRKAKIWEKTFQKPTIKMD
jgi:hypothetical protein